jgi:hypothetical protein
LFSVNRFSETLMRAGLELVSRDASGKLHDEHMTGKDSCPRCDKRGLKNWSELSDEEREVVKRLPLSAEYELKERQARHRWCTRCWYEEKAADVRG